MKKRKNWIDWCKIFTLYLVTVGHFPNRDELLCEWFYVFHIPLFFIISGYLVSTQHNSIFQLIKKNIKSLLIPYFLLVFIGYAIETVVKTITNDSAGGGSLINSILGYPPGRVSPMWFVFCLFFVKCLDIFCIRLCTKQWLKILFYTFVIIAIPVLINFKIGLPQSITWIFVAYPFWVVGRFLKNEQTKYLATIVFKRLNNYVYYIALLAVIILPLIAVRLNGYVDIYYCILGNIVLYYTFSIFVSICIFIIFKRFLDIKSDIITTLSKGALIIVAFHRLVYWPFEAFKGFMFVRLLAPLLAIILLYYPIVFCMKYLPILVGNRK